MLAVKILFSILIPPIGVLLESGLGRKFFINVPLTMLGGVPGIIHAIWNLSKD